MPCNFYLRTVDRRWKKELKHATQRVVICSPYLSPRTAETVVGAAPVENCEVYTRFSIEDFASGASSIRTLRHLHEAGYRLFELPQLHAKVVLVSGGFVSIGSQNLTANGVRNREATYVSTSPKDAQDVEAYLEPWLAYRRPITREMITQVEALLPPITAKFKEAKALAAEAEALIRKRELEREEARLLEEQKKAAEEERLQKVVAVARQKLLGLAPEGKVPLDVAKHFVSRSGYWYSHPRGYPAAAPRHARNIEGSNYDWKVAFGANSFLVARAVYRCVVTCNNFLKSIEDRNPWSKQALIDKLYWNVVGAVSNYRGAEYDCYPTTYDGHMQFGAQSINVNDFIQTMIQEIPLELRQLLWNATR